MTTEPTPPAPRPFVVALQVGIDVAGAAAALGLPDSLPPEVIGAAVDRAALVAVERYLLSDAEGGAVDPRPAWLHYTRPPHLA